ncbi:hypothetical protein [Emticicia sp. SJ17W-69]|uniref:hypothetical protein n=1 Tax=Emticicia sp. SJ17W-69 TaxID=3421657 RepID=UPI003EC0935E
MKKRYILLVVSLLCQNIVFAQATRTWVSGVGDDVNPCSRTAPCKTFAGAISKTAAGGEISVLDPGGYGSITITKSITINGDGTLASILHSGVNGIIINAGVNDIVVIRNISLNGAGTTIGTNAIRFIGGGQLHVLNCTMSGFSGKGIDVNKTTAGILTVENTAFNGPATTATGIYLTTTTGAIQATLKNVSINGIGTAIEAANNSVVNIENAIISNNSVGVLASDATAIIRLSNTNIFSNTTFGIGNGTGKVISFGNNNLAGNAADSPMQVIAKQ